MNKYECIILVLPNITEEQQREIEDKYTNLIKQNGKFESSENLGKRKLAYEVKKNKEGIYIQFYFESDATFITELERQFRIDDNVMKFMVVKREE